MSVSYDLTGTRPCWLTRRIDFQFLPVGGEIYSTPCTVGRANTVQGYAELQFNAPCTELLIVRRRSVCALTLESLSSCGPHDCRNATRVLRPWAVKTIPESE